MEWLRPYKKPPHRGPLKMRISKRYGSPKAKGFSSCLPASEVGKSAVGVRKPKEAEHSNHQDLAHNREGVDEECGDSEGDRGLDQVEHVHITLALWPVRQSPTCSNLAPIRCACRGSVSGSEPITLLISCTLSMRKNQAESEPTASQLWEMEPPGGERNPFLTLGLGNNCHPVLHRAMREDHARCVKMTP